MNYCTKQYFYNFHYQYNSYFLCNVFSVVIIIVILVFIIFLLCGGTCSVTANCINVLCVNEFIIILL